MASNDHTDGDPAIRKVQFTGGSTYTVSLPKDWARDQDLSAGASLYLYSLEDRVVVAPTEQSERSRWVTVAADQLDPSAIERRVRAAYVTGADGITVENDDGPLANEARRAARDAVTALVGLGVTDEEESAIQARSMLDATDVSLDQTLAQLQQLSLSTLREAVAAVVEDDPALASSIPDRQADVDRLVALVARQFHAALVDVSEVDRLAVDRSAAFRRVETARGLAGVADQASAIAAVAHDQKTAPAEQLADGLDDAGAAVRDLLRTGMGEDPAEAFSLEQSLDDKVTGLADAVHESADPDATRYARVVERLSQTTSHGAAIARARLRGGLAD